jgi:hypothetical protein
MVVPRYFVQLLFLLLFYCYAPPKQAQNPINNKTIKDSNGTALALSSFLKLPAAGRKKWLLVLLRDFYPAKFYQYKVRGSVCKLAL